MSRDYAEMQRRNGAGLMESMEVRQLINKLEAAERIIKDISELPDKWRFTEGDNCTSQFGLNGCDCADELQAKLNEKTR
jgi:hypothetical protein